MAKIGAYFFSSQSTKHKLHLMVIVSYYTKQGWSRGRGGGLWNANIFLNYSTPALDPTLSYTWE